MATTLTALRLDPWPPEYDSAVQFSELEESTAGTVDPTVETQDWKPLPPTETHGYQELCFVDGVRRVEARVLADSQAKIIHGLLGSVGVGAVRTKDSQASFTNLSVSRFLILGGGFFRRDEIHVGEQTIIFEGLSSTMNSPLDLLGELQNLMRTQEADLGKKLTSVNVCVFVDGPLTYFASARDEIVGIIKTIHFPYLASSQFSVVRELQTGWRTPLFSIKDGKYDRYSWFLRIAQGRVLDHPFAGIIRLEVRAAVGLQNAKKMADFSSSALPRFVSSAARDPRAPQNLAPVGMLETELRHRLGDPLLIRRAIEKKLWQEVTS